jgi:addiction module RelE/StbE family toxin
VRLIWTYPATADRKNIHAYIEQDNPAAAIALTRLFLERASQLTQLPGLGRPGRATGTRELVVRSNYILVYSVTKDAIHILRVLHAARQWP